MTKKPVIPKNAPTYAHFTGVAAGTCGECRHVRAAKKGIVQRSWCAKAMDLMGLEGEGKTIDRHVEGCKYWEAKA